MDKINELIKKYFIGKTTLEDEKILKKYFLSGEIKLEHQVYKAMFEAFDFELTETFPAPLAKKIPLQHNVKKFWIQTISFSGIAATLLLALWFFGSQPDDSFAIMRGQRIDNPEYAEQYVRIKFSKVNKLLTKSMKPMAENIETVRSGMKPFHKISETKERIQEIKNKLQY